MSGQTSVLHRVCVHLVFVCLSIHACVCVCVCPKYHRGNKMDVYAPPPPPLPPFFFTEVSVNTRARTWRLMHLGIKKCWVRGEPGKSSCPTKNPRSNTRGNEGSLLRVFTVRRVKYPLSRGANALIAPPPPPPPPTPSHTHNPPSFAQGNTHIHGLTLLMSPSWHHTSCTWKLLPCSCTCTRCSPKTPRRRRASVDASAFKTIPKKRERERRKEH